MTVAGTWDRLGSELLDTLQHDAIKRGKTFAGAVRTAETKHVLPRAEGRRTPKLRCPYCGRARCSEHKDLPALDPYFNGGR